MTGKKTIRFQTEIVNGLCPTCEEMTMLVGITPEMYRCISCGTDLQQHINGVISYIPRLHKHTLQSKVEDYFNGEES
jgi:tRNA(Ile2) C34 agmatinyltransferase TiaS